MGDKTILLQGKTEKYKNALTSVIVWKTVQEFSRIKSEHTHN